MRRWFHHLTPSNTSLSINVKNTTTIEIVLGRESIMKQTPHKQRYLQRNILVPKRIHRHHIVKRLMEPWKKKEHKQTETTWQTSTTPAGHPKTNTEIFIKYTSLWILLQPLQIICRFEEKNRLKVYVALQ